MKTKKLALKLALNRETLRALQDTDLRLVIGGWEQQPIGPPNMVVMGGQAIPMSVAACIVTGAGCPCASSITDGGGGGYVEPLPPNG
jgi:hypothetical protein